MGDSIRHQVREQLAYAGAITAHGLGHAQLRLNPPPIRILLTSGDPGAQSDDLPECVTFIPKPWRGLDVLVQAEKAAHDPQPPVT